MSCEDCPPAPNCPDGIPAWVMTFADLMSLLLAFFVLLFSFSEMDAAKYKQVAGSMREAFGIQREIKVKDPPKGINIIAQEFSAGTPSKSSLNEMRQETTDDFMQFLRLPKPSAEFEDAINREKGRLQLALAEEIKQGFVEIKVEDRTIVVSILEQGSFPSGSDKLIDPFRAVLDKMAKTIGANPGEINVAGHTDSRPIRTARFRSNWDLSASRAVTVVHALMQQGSIPENRFRAEGYGDTRPVDTNDTSEGQARNRRVEVNLVYDESLVEKVEGTGEISTLADEDLYFDAAAAKRKTRAKPKAARPKVPPRPTLRSWAEEFSTEARRKHRPVPENSMGIDPCPGCDDVTNN